MGPRLYARLVGAAIAVLRATLTIDRLHTERYESLRARGVPILFTLWHGRMFLPIQLHRREGVVTMASQSKDGEIIADWLENNGYRVVRGSTTRGGGTALKELIRAVRAGHPGALTVDGPQGPPRVVQPGIVELAKLTKGWILPISFASRRPRFLASWDRYLLPKAFSRNVVTYGEPFAISESMPEAEARVHIGDALDAITQEADRAVGVAPPPPWQPV